LPANARFAAAKIALALIVPVRQRETVTAPLQTQFPVPPELLVIRDETGPDEVAAGDSA